MTYKNNLIFKEGQRVYACSRVNGRYVLDTIEILETIQTYTPKGKPRPLKYRYRFLNIESNDVFEADLAYGVFPKASEAVTDALRNLFNRLNHDTSPETRLLHAIFGEDLPHVEILPGEIAGVIDDLRDFQKLLAEAFKIDAESTNN